MNSVRRYIIRFAGVVMLVLFAALGYGQKYSSGKTPTNDKSRIALDKLRKGTKPNQVLMTLGDSTVRFVDADTVGSIVLPANNGLRISSGTVVRGSDSPTLNKSSQFTSSIYNHLNGYNDAWVNSGVYYSFLVKNNGELWGWSDGTNSDNAVNNSIFHYSPINYGKFNAAVNSISNIGNFGIGAYNLGYLGICTGAFSGNLGFNGQSTAVASINFGRDGFATAQYAMNFGAYGTASGESSFNFGENSTVVAARAINFGKGSNIDINSLYGINFGYNGQFVSSSYSTNFGNNGAISNSTHGINFANGGTVSGALSAINFAESGTVTGNYAYNMSVGSTANSYNVFRLGLYGTALTGQNLTTAVSTDFKFLIDNGSSSGSRNSTFSHIKKGWTQIRDVTSANSATTESQILPKSVFEVVSIQSGIVPSGGTLAQRDQVWNEETQSSSFWSITYTKGWLDVSSTAVADQNGMLFQTMNEAGGSHLYALRWNGTIYQWQQIY